MRHDRQRTDRRPPWWPENEAWPPVDRWGQGMRRWGRRPGRRFIRLAALWVLGFFVAVSAVITLGVWLVANVLGITGADPVLRLVSLGLLLVVFLMLSGGGRMVRRFTRPVGDLVDAASQIEAGDLTVRVRERGPREVRMVARAFNEMAEQLEATDARRRTFLADVTHELRTPLSVIRGQAEGILEGVYPGDPEHVAPVLDAARRLEGLIDDLRTLALADAGGLTLRREPVDISVLVNETLASFEAPAGDAAVRLTADIPADLPTINGDPGRLQSVLSNLLSNAIRHTPAGGSVSVAVRRSHDDLEVSVIDTGEGIAPDVLPYVFDRFNKGSSSTGSGLGLAIARDLVVAHGGTVGASSEPGSGTTIRFTLPS